MRALVQSISSQSYLLPILTAELSNLLKIAGQKLRPFFESNWVFLACKLIIGFVSAYDIFLTIKYVEFLPQMELNPIGRFLMHLDAGPNCELNQIACFVAAKFAGNFLTLAILEVVRNWHRIAATSIALSVAAVQVWLFLFLTAQ